MDGRAAGPNALAHNSDRHASHLPDLHRADPDKRRTSRTTLIAPWLSVRDVAAHCEDVEQGEAFFSKSLFACPMVKLFAPFAGAGALVPWWPQPGCCYPARLLCHAYSEPTRRHKSQRGMAQVERTL